MTLSEFIDKYNGKEIDFDNAYKGQCVDLFRQYIKEVLIFPQPKPVVGAGDLWTNYDTDPNLSGYFERITNTLEFIPDPGDVMVWKKTSSLPYGHIGVIKAATKTNFVSFDQNWKTISVCELIAHTYSGVCGVFRAKKLTNELTECLKQHTELVTKCNKLDEDLKIAQLGLKETETKLSQERATTSSMVKELDTVDGYLHSLEESLHLVALTEDSRSTRFEKVMAAVNDLRQKLEQIENDYTSDKNDQDEQAGELETHINELEYLALDHKCCQHCLLQFIKSFLGRI